MYVHVTVKFFIPTLYEKVIKLHENKNTKTKIIPVSNKTCDVQYNVYSKKLAIATNDATICKHALTS